MKFLVLFISICLVLAVFGKGKGKEKNKHKGHKKVANANPCKPTQVHIALSDAYTNTPTDTSSSIRVVFHTEEICKDAYVKLHLPSGDMAIKATEVNDFKEHYESGPYRTVVHVFDLPNLPVGKTYKYTCYADNKDDNPVGAFEFYAPNPKPENRPTTVVMVGDVDTSDLGMTTVNALNGLVKNNFTKIDAIIHMGDVAYDLEAKAGKRGDDYGEDVQPITGNMPYMVFAGNHETTNNFSNFNMRYKMPNYQKTQNHLHSYNLGNIHFVVFNVELLELQPELTKYTVEWLKNDLKEANANRAERPWIVVMSHRPLYCSKKHEDCTMFERYPEIIQVLQEGKVDIYTSGHVHYYERMLPISNGKVAAYEKVAGDVNKHYIKNPTAPVYILQGIAGHRNYPSGKKATKTKSWTAAVSTTYSYNVLRSMNSTHLYVENILSETGKVNDYMYIIKDQNKSDKKNFLEI